MVIEHSKKTHTCFYSREQEVSKAKSSFNKHLPIYRSLLTGEEVEVTEAILNSEYSFDERQKRMANFQKRFPKTGKIFFDDGVFVEMGRKASVAGPSI